MPVIIVGADTTVGRLVADAMVGGGREVRAFVTDPSIGDRLRASGAKVAVGDVSDVSHVSGAAFDCFSAVLMTAAAGDGRERWFAGDPGAVLRGWAEAVAEAGVQRVIWVEDGSTPVPTELLGGAPEETVVAAGLSPIDIAAEVHRLDDLPAL